MPAVRHDETWGAGNRPILVNRYTVCCWSFRRDSTNSPDPTCRIADVPLARPQERIVPVLPREVRHVGILTRMFGRSSIGQSRASHTGDSSWPCCSRERRGSLGAASAAIAPVRAEGVFLFLKTCIWKPTRFRGNFDL